ncbi:TonB-dependent receptor [Albimonas sp. CAU 1670]|uniref:TonB-dependent receptor domain-containing protein n=1 Tax=Albimonas sp. CAU 1670 TaxID=3032599 RepID=UPI0023DBAAA5|nr:TonB-dependent receptor [Albimonas sp. CAU 1670]MDF2234143.1 TonB-dependent receptor [Albimonas sp. CAU 1670]
MTRHFRTAPAVAMAPAVLMALAAGAAAQDLAADAPVRVEDAAASETPAPVLIGDNPADDDEPAAPTGDETLAAPMGDEAVLLRAIDVQAATAPPSAQPRAEIGREALERTPMRSVGDAFAATPGVNAVDDRRNPGLTVEVRGLRDRGRVTTTIDGARQNFQQSGHGSASLTYVDANLLREIEVDKSVVAGVGGAGSLAGSVGFRTLAPLDVLEPGERLGAQGKIELGDNAYRFNGYAAAAFRPSERVSALLALSRRELGDYAIGQAGVVRASDTSVVPDATPVALTGSDELSVLAKAVVSLSPSAELTLSYLDYRAQFQTGTGSAVDDQDTANRTAVARLDWAPLNSRHDVTASVYWNGVENTQDREARASYGAFALDYALDTFGASVEDRLELDTRAGALALTFGAEGFGDATSTVSVGADPTDDPDDAWFGGANPAGDRQVGGIFAQAELAPRDWLRLRGGLRLDGYALDGTASVYARSTLGGTRSGGYVDLPVDQSDWALLPSAGVSVLPAPGWELFVDYSEGWRPPTLSEAVFGGSHIGFDLFFAPNPNLRPERSRMIEAGAGFERHALLRPDDAFSLRASVYARQVSDYVTSATVYGRPGGGTDELPFIAYVNVDGTTRFRGAELEAAYAVDRFDLALALETLDVNVDGTIDQRPWNGVPDPVAVTRAPSSAPSWQASLTGRARLLDDRLATGLRLRFAGDSTDSLSSYRLDGFVTLDAWATLALTDRVGVRLSATNLTDQAYVDPRGSTAYPAPGRTFALALEARF